MSEDEELEERINEQIRKGFGSRDFEEDIKERFKRKGFYAVSPKSEWIRDHLLDVGRDYPYRMWIRFLGFCKFQNLDYEPGDYSDFNNQMYRLREAELVKVVERESTSGQAGNPEWGKSFHSVVEENLGKEIAWKNPTAVLYPYSSRRWIKEQRDKGLEPGEIAERAENMSPRDISVTAEQIREKIEEWYLD